MQRTNLVSRGRRRMTFVVTILTVGALAAGALATPLLSEADAAPPADPSSTIEDYMLFATEQLELKGGGNETQSILHGNVGVGAPSTWDSAKPFVSTSGQNASINGNYRLRLCERENGHLTMDADDYIVSPSFELGPVCDIKTAFGYAAKNDGAPTNKILSGFTPPNVTLPALPTNVASIRAGQPLRPATAACTDPDIVQSGTPTLVPNAIHGSVRLHQGVTYHLTAATYTFCNLNVQDTTIVVTQPGTVINVVGDLQLNGSKGFGSHPEMRVNVWGDGVAFGRSGTIKATINAPNAHVLLGHATNIFGRVWARRMNSDRGINVSAPTTTTTTSTSTSTSPSTSTSTTSTTIRF